MMFPRKVEYTWLAQRHSHSNFSDENQQLGLKAELSEYCVEIKINHYNSNWYLYTVNTTMLLWKYKNNNNCTWISCVTLKMKQQDCHFWFF